MATDLQTPPQADPRSMSSLVGGIVTDAQDLIKQHLQLFRQEIKEDLRKTKQAALPLILGLGLLAVGGVVVSFMAAHLLHWAGSPGLLLWHCFAIVGGPVLLLGGILVIAGKKMLDSFDPLPDKSLEEVQWTVKAK